jgi:hypothetical protein
MGNEKGSKSASRRRTKPRLGKTRAGNIFLRDGPAAYFTRMVQMLAVISEYS